MFEKLLNIFKQSLSSNDRKFKLDEDICSQVNFAPVYPVVLEISVWIPTLFLNILLTRVIFTVKYFRQTFYKVFIIYSFSSVISWFLYAITLRFTRLEIFCPNLTSLLHYHGRTGVIFYLPRVFLFFVPLVTSIWIAVHRLLIVIHPGGFQEMMVCKLWFVLLTIFGISALGSFPICWSWSFAKVSKADGMLLMDGKNDLKISHPVYLGGVGLATAFIILVITVITVYVANKNSKAIIKSKTKKIFVLGLITSILTWFMAFRRAIMKYALVNEDEVLTEYSQLTNNPFQLFAELSPAWWFLLLDSKVRSNIWSTISLKKKNSGISVITVI